MNSLISILPALIVFGVLIIVHEFGHFIACRFSKIRVEKFSIGFGPELVHWQSGETRFSISLFPLGGFVSPAGEEASKVGPEGPKPGDFLAATVLSHRALRSLGDHMLHRILNQRLKRERRYFDGSTVQNSDFFRHFKKLSGDRGSVGSHREGKAVSNGKSLRAGRSIIHHRAKINRKGRKHET